ncbi:hypothetical protein TVAG_293060 [Trichomonas vaginalis G3]|uniref:Uncharacterized protein n=1 Tax=Trichomonas vaginalis (strain ATCC PRA-98 / G3) TaxID=412133 RepID=A2EWZ6_TRIV3|nr:tyrosine phosphatase superdomain-containing protein [Trichomonas vaginalis G3]EAY02838.1 hypothetical protein TVAG_293060 [Trichomonas vaginalis G3]KAI5525626.1 tyrosine phosphatase superdomain-containing protein [Trichomonas vaginalis G3]|eukprot:XP_001315061.1 hypothetical protein [Trichomonas vaginalis G3]
MGRKGSRSTPGPTVVRSREIPMWWLSAPKISQAIKSKNIANLTFFTTKAPLELTKSLIDNVDNKWTVDDVKAAVNTADANYFVINASLNQPTNEEEWQNAGFKCGRIEVNKEYEPAAIDAFEKLVDGFVAESDGKPVVIVVFSTLGINRPGFLISAFLSRKDLNPIDDNLKELSKLMECPVYAKKATVSLCATFNTTIEPTECPFISEEPKPTAPAEASSTIERLVNWRRFTRKEIEGSERDKVLAKLKEALPEKWPFTDGFPDWPTRNWDDSLVPQIKSSNNFVSFVPRGKQAFLVILSHKSIYTVSLERKVYLLLASFKESHRSITPIVCAVTWTEEKLRVSAILSDIMMFENKTVYDLPIQERTDILYDEVIKRLISEIAKSDAVTLQFIYRPLARLQDTQKLIDDLDKFACNPEAIAVIPADQAPGNDIIIPFSPTISLFFEYNGGQKAVLFAYKDGKADPVCIYNLEDKKEINYDNCLIRVSRKDEKWSILTFFANTKSTDSAATLEQVKAYIETVNTLPDLEKVAQQLIGA